MKLSLVVPELNESENIPIFVNSAEKIMQQLRETYVDFTYELIFVDDGSTDNSIDVIKSISTINSNVHYVALSRNFGHQNALRAGLEHSSGDAVISLDADLQHPIELIPQMVECWQQGVDIVYTVREDDDNIGFVKKTMSKLFYQLNNFFSDVHIDSGAADFRLVDRAVKNVFSQINETFIFWRGWVKWVGFKTHAIHYKANSRINGQSRYTWKKMLLLAFNGLSSFSVKPLYLSSFLGVITFFAGFFYMIYCLYGYFTGKTIPGWTSTILLLLLLSGVQMIILGVMGAYLGKVFIETKRRPPYIVRECSLRLSNDNYRK